MLRSVFVGSNNAFDRLLVHWLSQHTDVVGVVWTISWRSTWKTRLQFAQGRLRRYGPLKLLNEALLYCYSHWFLNRRADEVLLERVIEPYHAQYGIPQWRGDSISAADVNDPAVLQFVRQRQPDIAFAMCTNQYFGKQVRSIPKFGVFLWHEGITPEYKGLHLAFWALHNLDFDGLGYTVLRMNDRYDAGEIFVQGPAVDVNPFHDEASYIGHKAIFDSLPAVERFLLDLEEGVAKPIDRSDARPGYYTYPGITDLIRQKLRLRMIARVTKQVGPSGNRVGE